MKLPNKVISFKDSNLSKFAPVLDVLKENDETVLSLYNRLKKHFNDIQEYIDVLDCLFALEKINISNNKELYYVA